MQRRKRCLLFGGVDEEKGIGLIEERASLCVGGRGCTYVVASEDMEDMGRYL